MAILGGVLFRKLRRDVWARKGSLVALLAIAAVGVGCLVAMLGVYRDLYDARRRYYAELRLAEFTVDLKRAPAEAVAEVAALPNVRVAYGRVSVGVLLDLPGVEEPVGGTAISLPVPRRPVLNDVTLCSGMWFSGPRSREVILNDAFAKANGLKPGDRIRATLVDSQYDLLMVGTAMSPEFVYLLPPGGFAPDDARFGVLYLPEDFLRDAADLSGACNQILGWCHDASRTALDNTLRLIERRLDPWGVTNATPVHEQASVRFLADEITGVRQTAAVVPSIFLAVAALALNVLMGRLVTQQRTTIGTLLAVGYSHAAVMRHYLGFGVLVGALGGLGGAAVGAVLESMMAGLYAQFYHVPGIRGHVYPDLLLMGFGVSIGFSLIGTVKGVRGASRLAPAEAMQPPTPERCGKVIVERIPGLWRALSFRWKMILRAVLRNPYRSGVSIGAAAVSTALIVAVLSMVDALDFLMFYTFEKLAHQDVTIALRDPVGERVHGEVGGMPSVIWAEPQLVVACDLSNGSVRKRTGVTGLPRGARLSTPLDSNGNPIVVPSGGLVLSRKLAEMLDLRAGDTARLRPLVGRRTEVVAPILGSVDTYLGLSAFAELGYLSRLLGEEWSSNVVLANTVSGSADRALLGAVKERASVIGIERRTRALEQVQETLGESMGASIGVMVLFAGLIAFGSMLNAALVSLSERRRDVGTLRVLGFTPRQIAGVFGGESYLLSAVGVAVGVALGIGLAHLLSLAYNTELYRWPVVVRPWRLLESVVLMAIFVGVAQAVVASAVRRQDWLESLKSRE